MSFSREVREELTEQNPRSAHCRIALLAGIITLDGKQKWEKDGQGHLKRVISIRMEQNELVAAVKLLLQQIFGFSEEDYVIVPRNGEGARLRIEQEDRIIRLISTLKLTERNGRLDVDEMVFSRSCCRSSFLRGAYLAAGSVTDPNASYQLEIVTGRPEVTSQLKKILSGAGISAKVTVRRGLEVLYTKDAEVISELLAQMGAANGMMELENIRIVKEIRNSVNREVNCDTANISRITKAAGRCLEDIRMIEQGPGLSSLPAELLEIAELRREYPDISLAELGNLLDPPLGKSGVNHRLRRLHRIAEQLNGQ